MRTFALRARHASFVVLGALCATAASACAYTPQLMVRYASEMSPESFASHAAKSPENLEAGVRELVSFRCNDYAAKFTALEARKDLPTMSHSARVELGLTALKRCPSDVYETLVRANVVAPPNGDTLMAVLEEPGGAYEHKVRGVETVLKHGVPPAPRHLRRWIGWIRDGDDSITILKALLRRKDRVREAFAPALVEVAQRCQWPATEALLAAGARPTTTAEGSPLGKLNCFGRGSKEKEEAEANIVDALLAAGADPKTACLGRVAPPTQDKLLAAGADPNHGCDGASPLAQALVNGRLGEAEKLIRAGAIPSNDLLASEHVAKNPGLASLMLDKGARPDAPAVAAAIRAKSEVVAVKYVKTMSAGFDAELGEEKSTLLHSAVAAGMAELVTVLVAKKAPVNKANLFGELPLDVAEGAKDPKMVGLLTAAGGGRGNPAAIASAKQAFADKKQHQREEEARRQAEEREAAERARERRELREQQEREEKAAREAEERAAIDRDRRRVQADQERASREMTAAAQRIDEERRRQQTSPRSSTASPPSTGPFLSSSGPRKPDAAAEAREREERERQARYSRERDEQMRRQAEEAKRKEAADRAAAEKRRAENARIKQRCDEAERRKEELARAEGQCIKTCEDTRRRAGASCREKHKTLSGETTCSLQADKDEGGCKRSCYERHKSAPLPDECFGKGVSR
jgi:hypothetical protein